MFEGDSADTCAVKFSLVSMGGRAEGLACAPPGARTPIGASGNLNTLFVKLYHLSDKLCEPSAASLLYIYKMQNGQKRKMF